MRTRRIAILAVALALQGWPASARELGAVLEQRLTIERGMAGAINTALEHLLGSRRAFATVSVELDQQVLSKSSLAGNARAMSFTVGKVSSEKYMKLPGLPRMRPGKISEPVRIRIDPKKKKVVSTKVVGLVKRVRIRLYIDPKLTAERVKAAEQVVRDAAGLDTKRGDSLIVTRLLVAGSTPVSVALKPESVINWSALAIPISVVFASLVLGLALWQRRRASGPADGGVVTERVSRRDEVGRPGLAAESAAAPGSEAALIKERGARYLPTLKEIPTEELVALLGELEAKDAELVLALAPLTALELAAVVDRLAAQPKQAKIIASLARKRDVKVAQITTLAQRVDQGLERVRNPEAIAIGAPERLGQILRVSSRNTTRSVLAWLEREPDLSAAVRKTLMQFEDLPELPSGTLRRLVAALDPTVLATALVGADAKLNDAVRGVLSARLERILREEQQALGKDTPEAAIEAAREEIQLTLNQLERDAAHA